MILQRSRRGIALLWVVAAGACARPASVSTAPQPVSTRPALPPPAAPDVEFMTGMIGHHAQAIVMAKWAPTHGASASLQIMAARIINSQEDEIATMARWLRDHNLPVPDGSAHGMTMHMDGMDHVMLMPGMLTEDQMKALDAARGVAFDRLFLTFMIQHHTGALTMVDKLFGSYGAAQDEIVFKFANDVNADQGSEIDRMHTMLDALPPAPGTAP
ncbi:MAG: DUF305 domain-containing protein [Gemmatimonadota bacterium]